MSDENTSNGSGFGQAGDQPVAAGTTTDPGSDQVDHNETSPAPVTSSGSEDNTRAGETSEVPEALGISPPAADPEGDVRRGHINNLVEEWWNDHFPGSVVGRSVEIWNYVHGAKDSLKTKLEQWLKPKVPEAPNTPPAD